MADPVSAGIIIATVTAAASTAFAGVQASSQADAESKAAKYNAEADVIAGNQASQSAAANEANTIRSGQSQLGEQAAGLGEANIGTGGSAGDVEKQSASNARLDALNVWYGGELERHSAFNAANLERYQQLIQSRNSTSDLIAGGVGAGTKIASGAAQYGAYQKYGIPPTGSGGTF